VIEPKTRAGDQSHHHQAVFNVIACLQRVIPEIECLRYMAAKTNQQEQKRAELKKLPPHFDRLSPSHIPRAEEDALPDYTSYLRLKMLQKKDRQLVSAGRVGPPFGAT
jgi:hypothetical protein